MIRRHPFLALIATALAAAAVVFAPKPSGLAQNHPPDPARPRSVILLIGDGMGISQVTLGRMVNGAPLALDGFPVAGFSATSSTSCAVTDSAAAGTALSTGVRTRNHAVGVDPEGHSLVTLLEAARDAGMRTGVVTTTRVTHATPAAYFAHVEERDDEAAIVQDLVRSRIDVALGGGARYFSDDARSALRDAGYRVVTSGADLDALPPGTKTIGLFSASHMAYEVDRDGTSEPSIEAMTRAALRILGGDGRPFFIMIEGGRIDHACHAHDAASAAQDLIAFDRAVAACRSFAADHGDVLVVVTADHATGAMGISEFVDLPGLRAARASAESVAPLIRQAPDVQAARRAAREASGLPDLADDVIQAIRQAAPPYGPGVRTGHAYSQALGVFFYPVPEYEQMTDTHGHDGADVPIYAAGPGATEFAGSMENRQIAIRIARLVGLRIAGTPSNR